MTTRDEVVGYSGYESSVKLNTSTANSECDTS
jgi:hypothetical protein